MSRTIVALVLILLAGCTAGPLGGPDADAVDGPTGCDPVDVPQTSVSNESRTYPALPETLSRSTAREYAIDFESAFAWHRAYKPGVDEVHVYTNRVDVGTDENGYVVEIENVEISTYDESPEGNTAGSDGWSAFYLINDSTVLRGEGRADSSAETPPRGEWRTVCGRTDGS